MSKDICSKNIALLGSTGSIGTQTLDVIEGLGFTLHAIAALDEVDQVFEQAKKFRPRVISMFKKETADLLRDRLKGSDLQDIEVLHGLEGTLELVHDKNVDIVVNAIAGANGLLPGLEAVKAGKRLASANKECFVMAGHLFSGYQDQIIPVDSEHSALFQGLLSGRRMEVSRLILTASGGPFFRDQDIDLSTVTAEMALNHPNWSMGPRITIDSATMFNKGLEIIEARWLFDIPPDKIDVVIHPQSIIHSIVEFTDGTQIAQLSHPDMRLPIQYALTFPERRPSPIRQLNLWEIGKLEFFSVPSERFPALETAMNALRKGGIAPTIANAADEIAVSRFLNGEISFPDIARTISRSLDRFEDSCDHPPSLEEILDFDKKTRDFALSV